MCPIYYSLFFSWNVPTTLINIFFSIENRLGKVNLRYRCVTI